MNGLVLLIENGGYVVQNLLVLWTAFLPLGDRFSLDALRASYRERRERCEDANSKEQAEIWCLLRPRDGRSETPSESLGGSQPPFGLVT